jgi:MFS family permease
VTRARSTSVAASFFLNGLAFASWAARIPDVRHQLGLSDAGLGLLLLALSAGSVLALPLSGVLVHRAGAAAVVRGGAVLVGVALALVALAVSGAGSVTLTAPALFLYGVGTSVWDVAMNVEGAAVERQLGRSVMPRFHAAFSVGTVAGALVGALAAHLSPDLRLHLVVVGVVAGVGGVLGTRGFVPTSGEPSGSPSGAAGAWRERRTLLIGVLVLALAFTEGSANDWLAVALRDGYDAPTALAVLGFALFVAAMTTGRVIGPVLLDRWGRVVVLRVTVVLALLGVLLTVFGATPWIVAAGIVVWGLGASLGFPVGMSAAADDPARAAARVSVVSTMGYTAFLAGPPLIGFVASHTGTLDALLLVAGALGLALLAVGATRPPEPVSGRPASAPLGPPASGSPSDSR